jgi:hypothetical protein
MQHMFERPAAHENGVELLHESREIDLGVHSDPVGLPVWAGDVAVETACN